MNRQPTEWKEILANDVRAADIEKKLVVTREERERGWGGRVIKGYEMKRYKHVYKISYKDILYNTRNIDTIS